MGETKKQIETLKKKVEELEKELKENKKLAKKAKEDEKKPIYNLYSWKAPDRIVVEHSKTWYTIVVTIAVIGIFYALLTYNFLFILAILAIIFLIYAINVVPPLEMQNHITNKGVRVGDELYLWKDIDYFWVTERHDQLLLNIELKNYGGRVILLVGEADINKILVEMVKHEDYREPKGLASLISRLVEGKHKKLTEFSK
ncbi:hypothetical protein GF362_03595 [Candidatus Dojkabacteria bacterium]|nr:hypothetical protein [Candidatus Dojkabacteria bacterium]